MTEKKETIPEAAGLRRRGRSDTNDEYYVPDYVMRDFGEAEDGPSSSGGAYGQRSSGELLL